MSAAASGGAEDLESSSAGAIARGLWRPAIVIVAIAAAIALVSPSEVADEVEETREWFQQRGLVGVAIFLGFYVLAAVCLVPQSMLRIASGAVFGASLGVVVAAVGSTLGATACFAIARYVARGSLLRRLKRRPRFRRLDRMTRDHGPLVVAASRLIPIFPGNLLNYAFGLTQVRTKTFVLYSGLCMLPSSVVLVIGADAVVRGLQQGSVPWPLVAALALALVATLAATRIAYLRLRDYRANAGAAAY